MWMKVLGLSALFFVVSEANEPLELALESRSPAPFAWNDFQFEGKEVGKAADKAIFNDRSLAWREYGYGALGGLVAGTLGFFIGSGLESAIRGNKAKNGTLGFSGIRYDDFHGAFYGGCGALWVGSALTSYFTGAVDEEDGSAIWTLLGGAATTAAGMALASTLGVHDRVDWPAFIPLIALPATGATLAFNVSRYFNDRKRESRTAAGWQAPRMQWGWNDQGSSLRVDALRWSFQ